MPASINDSINFLVTIISILNPLGALPLFLALTRHHTVRDIRIISNSCTLAVMITIALSLVMGKKILAFFGIGIPSFTVGGGILIFGMAMGMVRAHASEVKLNKDEIEHLADPSEIGIVPLAIPMLSGPGTISSSIIYSKGMISTAHWIGAAVVILICGLLVKLSLTYARPIGNRIGKIGLNVMTRIMGIILLASSIEMITKGLKEILPILKSGL